MLDFTLENISSEEVERLRAVYGALAQSVRELIDATVRTEMDEERRRGGQSRDRLGY